MCGCMGCMCVYVQVCGFVSVLTSDISYSLTTSVTWSHVPIYPNLLCCCGVLRGHEWVGGRFSVMSINLMFPWVQTVSSTARGQFHVGPLMPNECSSLAPCRHS